MNEHHDTHLSMHTHWSSEYHEFLQNEYHEFLEKKPLILRSVRVGFGSVVSSMIG